MAVYVISDAHGHLRALDRVLERVSLCSDDALFVLGDMVDRGPDPVGVVRLVQSLPCAHALPGNHELMRLRALAGVARAGEGAPGEEPYDDADMDVWSLNGSATTLDGLEALGREELVDLLDWMSSLPPYVIARVAGRDFVLAHAGIDAGVAAEPWDGTAEGLDALMRAQSLEDLLWIRGRFWSRPTGLIDGTSTGAVVIAGHTPSIILHRYAELVCEPASRELGGIVEVGASWDTGGVPDRICVDCSAAAGWPRGRVGVLRLDDGARFYADIREGE